MAKSKEIKVGMIT